MEATHVYCARCRTIQPVAHEPLSAAEPVLGMKTACAQCGWVVLTMLAGGKLYCDVCDDIRLALLHEYRPAGVLSGGLVRCAECYASRARLYGARAKSASK